jgi:uncharacterized protein YebE (UPF0316 family)
MYQLEALPVWALAALIFGLRVVDVSLGTVRTISVVQGRVKLSVVLGFFEILVWVTAISQVIVRLNEDPLLAVAYAAGFATGNAAGILLERRMALGTCVVRLISNNGGHEIAAAVRALGQPVTTFEGQGRDGARTLLYATCERRNLSWVLDRAREVDPHVFYVVESAAESSDFMPLPHPTGWRGILKKK